MLLFLAFVFKLKDSFASFVYLNCIGVQSEEAKQRTLVPTEKHAYSIQGYITDRRLSAKTMEYFLHSAQISIQQ